MQVDGADVPTDEEGFLLDCADWSQSLAEVVASDLKIDMTPEHWMVVNYVREHFEERQSVPEARFVLKAMKRELGEEKSTRKYLYKLFPYGYGQQACKIAGMLKPRKLMLDV